MAKMRGRGPARPPATRTLSREPRVLEAPDWRARAEVAEAEVSTLRVLLAERDAEIAELKRTRHTCEVPPLPTGSIGE